MAAPFATRQLADLGARVIKIERASGDFARGYDTTVRGMSSYFVWLNRGKESLVLDLKSDHGTAVLQGLVQKADDLLVQCEAGLLSVTGSPEAPAKVGVSIADICAGMYLYSGVLTALLQRASTGRGDAIEVSMLEAPGEWMSQPYFYALYGGAAPIRSGAERVHRTVRPVRHR